MRAEEAISVSNTYTENTVIGMGAIKGAPCTIKSITKSGNLNTVVFEWTDLNNVSHESTMLVYDGTNGTNGTDGTDGADGFSPTIVVKSSTATEYILTITDKNGSYDTPNLKGSGGGGGASAMSDLTDVQLTSLANGQVLIYDGTASKWVNTGLTAADISYDNTTSGLVATKVGAAIDELAAGKVDKETGKGLSANDFTDTLKDKLDNIAAGAEVNTIEEVQVNGTALTPDGNKAVNVTMELGGLTNVDLNNLQDGQIIIYDATNNKWVNGGQTGTTYTAGDGIEIDQNNVIKSKVVIYTGTKAAWDQLTVAQKIVFTHACWTDDTQSGVVDNVPTQNSDNLVKSGGVWTGLDAKADKTALTDYQTKDLSAPITVDGTQETTVEGAVGAINTLTADNKTAIGNIKDGSSIDSFADVETALGDKADKVTSPISGDFAGLDANGNLTDSGSNASDFATAQSLAGEAATRSAMGAKNLLDTELGAREANGITYTRSDDGVITANGTATADAWDVLCEYKTLKAGRYILSGCPSGGSANTYFMYTEGGTTNYDYGEGRTFTLASDTAIRMGICVKNGQSPSDLKFYPMIRLATDSDSTYQPYAKTNKELTDEVDANTTGLANEVATRVQLGAHNLGANHNANKTLVNYGVTFTVNDDGSIHATAPSGVTRSHIGGYNMALRTNKDLFLPNGTYVVSGCDLPLEQGYIGIGRTKNGTWASYGYQADSTPVTFTVDGDDYTNDGAYVSFYLVVLDGDFAVDTVFKPMICLASDADTTYQPYAMTNRELTSYAVKYKKMQLASASVASGNITDFTITSDLLPGDFHELLAIIPISAGPTGWGTAVPALIVNTFVDTKKISLRAYVTDTYTPTIGILYK